MILVDSSVWIDYFNGTHTPQVELLDRLLVSQTLAIGDIILTEVLQGFRQDADYLMAKQLMTSLTIFNLSNIELAIKSADNLRSLRKQGITIRKTIDVIIATFCIVELHCRKSFPPLLRQRLHPFCTTFRLKLRTYHGVEIAGS